MSKTTIWHWLGILLVLLLGSALRIVGLEQSPPGLAPDEACNSYDAYSIWHTGRDQHGVLLPTVMRALNDYRMPLFMYSQAPLVGAGGLTVFNARLTAAFWGILALAALYRLGREWFDGRVALTSMAFLAISPWAVPLNRIAFEANATVAMALLAVGLFWRWRRSGRFQFLMGSSLTAGLGLYTYSTISLFLALILGMLVLASRREIRARWKQVLVAATVGILLMLPLVYNWVRYPEGMSARYREIAVFRPERPVSESLIRFAHNVWYNISLDYLFIRGDLDILQHPAGMGQLYHAQALLIPLGIVAGWRRREWRLPLLLTAGWVLASVVPVALTEPNLPGSGHALRGLPGVVPWQLWSGMGLVALHRITPQWRARQVLLMGVAGWVLCQGAGYFGYYFSTYPKEAAQRFDVPMQQTFLVLREQQIDGEQDIYFTCQSSWPYLHFLFLTRYDPHLLQQDLPEREERLFGNVFRVGKFHVTCDTQRIWDSGTPGIFVVPAHEIPEATLLTWVPNTDGTPLFKVVIRP